MIKNLPANARDTGDVGSIPGSGRYPAVGNGNSLQYSCLENSMGRGVWRVTWIPKSSQNLESEHSCMQEGIMGHNLERGIQMGYSLNLPSLVIPQLSPITQYQTHTQITFFERMNGETYLMAEANSEEWGLLENNWLYIVILLCRVTYGNSGQEKKKARILIYAEYIMRNAGLDEAQAGIKIAGRNINNLRYADDTTLWQ